MKRRHPGSKRTRRARRSAPAFCGCWHCLPSKYKLRAVPRTTVEAKALAAALVKDGAER